MLTSRIGLKQDPPSNRYSIYICKIKGLKIKPMIEINNNLLNNFIMDMLKKRTNAVFQILFRDCGRKQKTVTCI